MLDGLLDGIGPVIGGALEGGVNVMPAVGVSIQGLRRITLVIDFDAHAGYRAESPGRVYRHLVAHHVCDVSVFLVRQARNAGRKIQRELTRLVELLHFFGVSCVSARLRRGHVDCA